jgi:hypothetical protein
MGKTIIQEFLIGGFSDISTGGRDYGMGVVRIDQRFLSRHNIGSRWRRHELLRLRLEGPGANERVYAVLRVIDPADLSAEQNPPVLCLEYDDRLLLGVEKGKKATVHLSKAGIWGRLQYFRNHPNIVVRSYTRYTFMTGLFTTLLGAMAWALFKRFGP